MKTESLLIYALKNHLYKDKSQAFKSTTEQENFKLINLTKRVLTDNSIPFKEEIRNKTTIIKVPYQNSQLKFYYA